MKYLVCNECSQRALEVYCLILVFSAYSVRSSGREDPVLDLLLAGSKHQTKQLLKKTLFINVSKVQESLSVKTGTLRGKQSRSITPPSILPASGWTGPCSVELRSTGAPFSSENTEVETFGQTAAGLHYPEVLAELHEALLSHCEDVKSRSAVRIHHQGPIFILWLLIFLWLLLQQAGQAGVEGRGQQQVAVCWPYLLRTGGGLNPGASADGESLQIQ